MNTNYKCNCCCKESVCKFKAEYEQDMAYNIFEQLDKLGTAGIDGAINRDIKQVVELVRYEPKITLPQRTVRRIFDWVGYENNSRDCGK